MVYWTQYVQGQTSIRLYLITLEVGRLSSQENSATSWATHFDTNVFSCITAIQASLPALRKSPNGGRIIFVSSGAATGGLAGWGAYNAGKAAMNSICRCVYLLYISH